MKTQRQPRKFVVCVKNDGADDLEIRKLYEVLPDADAADHDYLRVLDESGEDYLYPASFFVTVDVPEESARALGPRGRARSSGAR